MKSTFGGLLAATVLLLSIGAPLRAQQGVEEASIEATKLPWSGWWWPAKTGHHVLGYRGEQSPLSKFDQLSQTNALGMERSISYHYNPAGADWWGHCHAWAAASLLENEPKHDVFQAGVWFRVGDLKYGLTESHFSDFAQFFGRRYNSAADDFQDMSPFLVWQVLRRFINQSKTGCVADFNPGPEVWSYPCYRYRVSWQSVGGANYVAQMTVWAADFLVHPDAVGTTPHIENYSFSFQAQGNQLVAGSDRWTGQSLQTHPDFIWVPTQRRAENTQLNYNLITQLNSQAR
jgi:hypothetical protein